MALSLSELLPDEELKRLIQRAERLRPLALEDLPLGELKRWLEQRFVTEAPNILLPRTVDTTQIADSAITADQITAGTITATEIAAGTITANEIAAGTITATELSANSVTTDKLAANAVTAEKIAAHTITAAEIAAGTITATEIAAGTITATEIAADTITADQIAANAITTAELAANSVTSAKIASGTIVSGNIAGGTITGGNIASGTITGSNLLANTITTNELSATAIDGMTITGALIRTSASGSRVELDDGGIRAYDTLDALVLDFDTTTGDLQIKGELLTGSVVPATTVTGQLTDSQLAAIAATKITGQITTTQITDDAITTPKVAAGAITTAEIAADTIVAGNIAAGAITATELDALAVTTAKLDAEAVTAAKIAANTITASQIAANTITANEIAANTIAASNIAADAIGTSELAADAVTADKINVGTLDAISVDAGTITAGTFRGPIFETAASAPKTRMDTTGIFVEDSSSNTVLRIDESGGLNLLYATFSAAEFLRKITWEDGSGNSYGEIYTAYDSTGDDSYLYLLANDPVGVNSYGFQIMEQNGGFGRIQFGGGGTQYVLEDQGHSDFQWARGWQSAGLNPAVAAGATVAIASGTETFDTELAGSSTSYTIPMAGIWRIDGLIDFQNPNADKRAIMTWRKGAANQGTLVSIFSNVAGSSVAAGGFIYANLAAGDVIDAVVTNGDSAARNIGWRLAVTWHSN